METKPSPEAAASGAAAGRLAAEERGFENRRRRPRGAFSPLTLRILAVNVIALGILVGGVLYLDQFRAGLIESRIEALITQGEIIAGALGEAATSGPDAIDLQRAPATQILRRLVAPTDTRARLFDASGDLVADSREILASWQVQTAPLPPPSLLSRARDHAGDLLEWIAGLFPRRDELPLYVERPDQSASDYVEAMRALDGYRTSVIRARDSGALVITVAIPVQRFRRVLGALMLSSDTAGIEAAVREQRGAIIELLAVAFAVTALLSIFLASTIVRPVIRLAEAAERIRRGRGRRVAIPDFTHRKDEIGDLSAALKDMTQDLYARIDAIDTFAADVAHELKNPLTSLRSAAETASRANDPEARAKLTQIMLDDVGRLDRLISDISQASRLDAELLRADASDVDLNALLAGVVEGYRATASSGGCDIQFHPDDPAPLMARCIEARIGQVVRNLVDNAISFSPPGGRIAIRTRRAGSFAVITVEDEGPGIPENKLEEIFSRFYSERPESENFGAHSGLGLSISKQIVQAHDGRISAENLYAAGAEDEEDAKPIGARFTVLLPLDPSWTSLRR